MKPLARWLPVAVMLLVGCSAMPTTLTPMTTPTPANQYAIVDVTVVDVEKGIAVPGQTVLIEDDRIDQIGAPADLAIPAGARVVNARGLYLMPGLVDAHVHFLDAPVFGRLMIANGVVLVRDMGMLTDYILKVRDELNRGETLGPQMIATGTVLDGDPPLLPSISVGLPTPEAGRAAVRAQAAAGVDEIKVYSGLAPAVFQAIMDEAQKLGLKVVGHVPDSVYLEEAAAAGLRSSEHFFGFEKVIAKLLGDPVELTYAGMGSQVDYLQRLGEVDPKALQAVYQRLRASGLTVCPTVVVFKTGTHLEAMRSGSWPQPEYISQKVLDVWKSQMSQQGDAPDFVWRNWALMVNGLNQAGVPLMVGTDLLVPGILPGYSVHEEMTIWQAAGLRPAEILRSATIVPAQFMGLGDHLGSVRVGKTASMVLVRANPLDDIGNARQIEGVFLRGRYFSRSDLDQLVAEAKEIAQQPAP